MDRKKANIVYSTCIGVVGITLSFLLVIIKKPIFPVLPHYILFFVSSSLAALLYLSVKNTIVSFEIAIFLFITLYYGPYAGSFTAAMVMLFVWLGKAIYFSIKKEAKFLNVVNTGIFNAGTYGLIYLAGGIVHRWTIGRWYASLLAIIIIIIFNEIILTLNAVINGRDIIKYFKEEAIVSDLIELLIYPLGISFYLLYDAYGIWAVTPVLSVLLLLSYMGRSYSNYQERLRSSLSLEMKINESSRDLNTILEPEELIERSLVHVAKLLPVRFVIFKPLHKMTFFKGTLVCEGEDLKIVAEDDLARYLWDLEFQIQRGDVPLGEIFIGLKKQLQENEKIALNGLIEIISSSMGKAVSYKESILDGLTGLYTRRYFEDMLKRQIAECRRYDGIFSIVIFDIDNLKGINDAYGHLKGDEVLVEFSRVLKKSIRETDIPARWGGDEFVLILIGVNEEMAEEIAMRVKRDIESRKFHEGGSEFSIGVTFSCMEYTAEKKLSAEELFYFVDSKLLARKKEKRK